MVRWGRTTALQQVFFGNDVLYVGAERPIRYVWHVSDEIGATIFLQLLMPTRSGKNLNDGRKNGDS